MDTKLSMLILVLVFNGIVCAQSESLGEKCKKNIYHTLGGTRAVHLGFRCCNGNAVRSGFSGNTFGLLESWKDPSADENENMTISAWRAYTTVLSQHLPRGQISFSNFSYITVKNYKQELRNSIVAAAELAFKNADPETKKFLLTDFLLTDYENVNKIRVIYFGIEKSVCSGKSYEPITNIDMWNNCDQQLELETRDGGCCRNNTIPFSNLLRNPYETFQCQNCSKSLEPFLQKLKLTDPKDERTLVTKTTCRLSCFLIEKKVITAASLIDVKETDEFPLDDVLEILIPTFLSKSVRELVKNAVKNKFDLKKVKQAMPKNTALGDKVSMDDLLACYAHDAIFLYINEALHGYCK